MKLNYKDYKKIYRWQMIKVPKYNAPLNTIGCF